MSGRSFYTVYCRNIHHLHHGFGDVAIEQMIPGQRISARVPALAAGMPERTPPA